MVLLHHENWFTEKRITPKEEEYQSLELGVKITEISMDDGTKGAAKTIFGPCN